VLNVREHHQVHVGYIPDGRIIGLSKIPQIVKVFAQRLQIQERLTSQVTMAVQDVLKPKGMAVFMESSHLCMVIRGVQKVGSSTTTSCFLGLMKEDQSARQEFLAAIKT
jgi:GTP cyclohydrolase IA